MMHYHEHTYHHSFRGKITTQKHILKTKHGHTLIFHLRFHSHTLSDPEYSLTFQRKFRQRGILKYLILIRFRVCFLSYFNISFY